MTAIRYQPGASYEEQLRIWANGNEDEHRLAVFLEGTGERLVKTAEDHGDEAGYRRGYEDGYDEGYSDGYDEGYSDGHDAGSGG